MARGSKGPRIVGLIAMCMGQDESLACLTWPSPCVSVGDIERATLAC